MKIFKLITVAGLVTASAASCDKEVISPLPIDTIASDAANLKIVHASAYTTNYAVQLKLNDVRVSSNITYSTPFPGGGLNTGGSNFPYYIEAKVGQNSVGLSVPKAKSNLDSIVLFSGNIKLDASKYYTAYLADTAANTQLVLFEENTTQVPRNFSRFKFLNLIPNLPGIDLYFQDEKVASDISFKSMSPEFNIPFDSSGQWKIRPTGALVTSTPIAIYPAAAGTQLVPDKKSYTVYSRGYSGATGNLVPAISLHQNFQ